MTNTSLIYKYPDQFADDSPPLTEAGSISSDQSQDELFSDESGLAELEEWHGIRDTTLESAESSTNPSSDHQQLHVKSFAGTSELSLSTRHI